MAKPDKEGLISLLISKLDACEKKIEKVQKTLEEAFLPEEEDFSDEEEDASSEEESQKQYSFYPSSYGTKQGVRKT